MILICGLPRAGKTTLSKKYDNVIHLDQIGLYSQIKKLATKDSVIDGVYDTKDLRMSLIDAVKADRNICIWVNTDLETIKKRGNRYWLSFEPPTLDEGWDEIIIVQGKEDNNE